MIEILYLKLGTLKTSHTSTNMVTVFCVQEIPLTGTTNKTRKACMRRKSEVKGGYKCAKARMERYEEWGRGWCVVL